MSGGDFYWGPAEPGRDTEPIEFSGKSLTMTVPEDFETLRKVPWKASHHDSGVMHVTGGGSQSSSDRWWGGTTDIVEPRRFGVVVTKPPSHYKQYTRSLTRGGASGFALRIPERQRERRHYFEFFLTPAGTFARPEPLLRSTRPLADTPFTHSLSERLILLIRHVALGGELSRWRPEVEIWLLIDSEQHP